MKKLKRSTCKTQLLSKLRCSLLYSLSTFCCTCFRACCKGHSKVKYESFAQKLKILMFEYQKTGNVSLTQNPGGCREHNDLQRRFDSTNMKKWYRCAKPAAPSSTGQKSYELCQRTSNCYGFGMGCTYHSQILSVEDFTTRPS